MNIKSKNQPKFCKNITIYKAKSFLPLLCILLFVSFAVKAQDDVIVIDFKQLSSENLSKQNQSIIIDSKAIKSLIVDLHPSVYLENGKINFYSQTPTTAFLDLRVLGAPINTDHRFESIEFISIRIDQPNAISRIDLSRLNVFPNLKYIYFACSVNCDASQIKNKFVGLNKYYTIIFRSENQS